MLVANILCVNMFRSLYEQQLLSNRSALNCDSRAISSARQLRYIRAPL